MSAITQTERECIQRFRPRVADLLPEDQANDDFYLVRWLRARELDLVKSEAMLIKSLAWRAKNNVDNILHVKINPTFFQTCPYYIEGLDKFGGPVLAIPFGQYNIRKIIENGDKKELIHYVNQLLERLLQSLKVLNDKREFPEENNFISQFTVILDFQEFAYSQLTSAQTVDAILEVVRMYEGNYPEILRRAFIINAPWIFSILMKLVKPLLSERTMSKLSIHSSKTRDWLDKAEAFVSPEQILQQFGGTKLSSDLGNHVPILGI